MKTINVSIGVYKVDCHESLFRKNDSSTYYDLKERKNVSVDEVDLSSFFPYNSLINCHPHLRRNIIKLYDLDRMRKVSLSKVFIGNLYQISQVVGRYYSSGDNVVSRVTSKCVQKDLLLELTNGSLDPCSYVTFQNMENNEVYKEIFLPNVGDFYIDKNSDQIRLFSDIVDVSQIELEKGKILEKYRM